MNHITITEKPDWISYDDILVLLQLAHAENREKRGFHVQTTEMTGEELEAHIGENGKCFVALDGEKLVGTASYRIVKRSYWCARGMAADQMLVAVHPDYQGRHVSADLFHAIEKAAREAGLSYIESTTAEANRPMRLACKRDGFRCIQFKVPHSDHYNVVMLKWLNGCPYPKWRTDAYFIMKMVKKKIMYKPGKIRRFGGKA